MMPEPLDAIKQAEKDEKRLDELENRLKAHLFHVNQQRKKLDLNELKITEVENSHPSYGNLQ